MLACYAETNKGDFNNDDAHRRSNSPADAAPQEYFVRVLFWVCAALVAYAYFGYAIWLALLARIGGRRPVLGRPGAPRVTVVLAVRNEEANLPAKLQNLRALDYPADCIQIVVVSDGSTDRTNEILTAEGAGVVSIILPNPAGKAAALNEAVSRADGEILFFQDARQRTDASALRILVSCFADEEVGAVSGELLLEAAQGAPSPDALGIYWKIEKTVRRLESETGSVVGVTGAIYAMRRELYTELPRGTILDDVFQPMHVARAGKRVLFEPGAIARDRIFPQKGKEFRRKVRTLTGNYQLIRLAPWMLTPANPLLVRFVSHKLLRLVMPFLLFVLPIAAWRGGGILLHGLFWAQITFYALALTGAVVRPALRFRAVAVANTFVMLNVAALLAFANFVAGRDEVWT